MAKKSVFQRAQDYSWQPLTKTKFRKLIRLRRSLPEQAELSQREAMIQSGFEI